MALAILVPIKSFDLAKGRLADALQPDQRADLARHMAGGVLRARGSVPAWVICDDPEVAAFATSNGAGVIWAPSRGLNPAVTDGVEFLAGQGAERVVVAHADLPLATDLAWVGDFDGVTIVPDRRDDGTNVLCVPTGKSFVFQYGEGSAARHLAEADRLGLELRVVPDDKLGWDVDVPEDLTVIDPTVIDPIKLSQGDNA